MYNKYIKNFLPEKLCKDIINSLNDDKILSDAITDKGDSKNYLDFEFNKRKMAFIKDDSYEELKKTTNLLIKYIEDNVDFVKLQSTNFLYTFNKYSKGDFLNYHSDGAEIRDGALYTIVVELSVDYGGGEFCFIDKMGNEIINQKSTGGLFIFDSNIKHKVNPITDGIRFSLNTWPKFKKNKVLI